MKADSLNVFGEALLICGTAPITGAYRNGCCDTGPFDAGTHTVCAVVTDEFLQFSKSKGNDLTRAYPQYNFPGLKPGDSWCICARTWLDALNHGKACPVDLEATNIKALEIIPLELLEDRAV